MLLRKKHQQSTQNKGLKAKDWDRTKRQQKIRENKGKQESMWSRVQKDGEESRESENTVG